MGSSPWPSRGSAQFPKLLCGFAPLSAGQASASPETWARLPPLLAPVCKPRPLSPGQLAKGDPAQHPPPRAKQPAWPLWAHAPHRLPRGPQLMAAGHPQPQPSCYLLVPAAMRFLDRCRPFSSASTQSDHGGGAWAGRGGPRTPALPSQALSWKEPQEWVILSSRPPGRGEGTHQPPDSQS